MNTNNINHEVKKLKKNSNSNNNRKVFKTTFASPLSQWPNISVDQQKRVLDALLSAAPSFATCQSKPHLIIGINKVTAALEQQSLSVVLVCRADTVPPLIIQHLPMQARVGGALLVTLPGGSAADLEAALHVSHAKVLGIPKTAAADPLERLKKEIEEIVPKEPSNTILNSMIKS